MSSNYLQVEITELVNQDFLEDDGDSVKMTSSTESLDESSTSSSLKDASPSNASSTCAIANDVTTYNVTVTVPSFLRRRMCDPSFSGEDVTPLEADIQSSSSPLSWRACVERAPYADEESFSIVDPEETDKFGRKDVTFICHM